ncbi:FAD-dependent oxidoreductase, partial [Bacillus thuringiensis]|nr:FAD-dependent oxidoreductase [Bacillus thuringiensis]
TIVQTVEAFAQRHLPGVIPQVGINEHCMYTMTPDEHFILDVHPHWKNIVIGAGFSGHGFKLAPVVGKVLAELAIGRRPSYDLRPLPPPP